MFSQDVTQNGVIDSRKVLFDVALQDVRITPGKLGAAVQGPVGAFADPVGVAVVNEAALKDRLNQVTQGVMDDVG